MDMEGIEQVTLFSIDVLVSYTTSPFAQTLIRRDHLYLESLAQNYVICFYARIFFLRQSRSPPGWQIKRDSVTKIRCAPQAQEGLPYTNKNLKVFQDGVH